MQRNFHTKYRPGKELSLDESTCLFKGRVHFKCYNPQKNQTGSILNFLWSVNLALATFVGLKFVQEMASGQSQGNAQELQDVSKTSCIVLGLLGSVLLLFSIIITIALT